MRSLALCAGPGAQAWSAAQSKGATLKKGAALAAASDGDVKRRSLEKASPWQLHYFLRDAHKNYAPEVGTIPRRLLEHNLKGGRQNSTSEMLCADADVAFEYDARSRKTDITFKAYF
jgi:hypothetical protein